MSISCYSGVQCVVVECVRVYVYSVCTHKKRENEVALRGLAQRVHGDTQQPTSTHQVI